MPQRTRCVFDCDHFDVLHRFPKPFDDRFRQWKEIVGERLEGKTDNEIHTNYRICNHHFESQYFYPNSKRLARTAYPTLNLDVPAFIQEVSTRTDFQAEREQDEEGAVSGDIQYRVSSTQSTTQSTCTLRSKEIGEKEIEDFLIDYQDEVIVTATESPPPLVPTSFQITSPSSRGHTSTVYTIEGTEAASDSPQKPPATPGRIFESPVSRRQLRQPRRSTLTRQVRTGQRVDQAWVVELERRRVDAESRLADAAMITAEAARIQAEASRDQAAALNKLLEILIKKHFT